MQLTNLHVRSGEYPTLTMSGELCDGLRFRAEHVLLPLEHTYRVMGDRMLSDSEQEQVRQIIREQRRVFNYPDTELESKGVA